MFISICPVSVGRIDGCLMCVSDASISSRIGGWKCAARRLEIDLIAPEKVCNKSVQLILLWTPSECFLTTTAAAVREGRATWIRKGEKHELLCGPDKRKETIKHLVLELDYISSYAVTTGKCRFIILFGLFKLYIFRDFSNNLRQTYDFTIYTL